MDSDAEGVPSEFFDYFKVSAVLCLLGQTCITPIPILNMLVFISFCSLPTFQVLCIQGFLTCRKHAERIILLVEMLQVRLYDLFLNLFPSFSRGEFVPSFC